MFLDVLAEMFNLVFWPCANQPSQCAARFLLPRQTKANMSTASATSSADTAVPARANSTGGVTDAAMAEILKKVDKAHKEDTSIMVRRTTSAPGLARRMTSEEMGLTPEQAAIIERMRASQDSLGGFLDSSKK